MKLLQQRFAQLRRKWHELQFRRAAAGVRSIGPIRLAAEGPIVLSMVQQRDVDAYLLALGTFVRRLPARRIVVVADPSLDAADQAVLRRQVPDIEIVAQHDFRPEGLPSGGCWERLVAITRYVSEGYVIQLDADTVATGPLDEVAACVRDNRAFTLGTDDHFVLQPASEAADFARSRASPDAHIQVHAEAALDRLPAEVFPAYIRGCAGFAGFPAGYEMLPKLLQLSAVMEQAIGARWRQWGSEQFASNVMVANAPASCVLPHPKYCAPHRRRADSVFLHFIGYVRYIDGTYARLARGYLKTA
ncbi:hypothetical protein [Plasticicumulans sp.]|uniref:hypothetical protein n=1 Tax=Plasticicumulans sp. TaxID=2307179 RepID=UPI002BA79D6A|nr:hypothetical protein [Plasticicumulans sp.]